MNVDRLSVTVPSKLGAAMRTLAKARGQSLSTLVADAIAHEIRLADLDRALAAADQRFGVIPGDRIDQAEAELVGAIRRGKRKPKRARR